MIVTDRNEVKRKAQEKAAQMWAAFDKNQKAGVRFGMFPAGPMRDAEKDGCDGKLLSVALMDEAAKDGGMRA
jgi:hypothetical protein